MAKRKLHDSTQKMEPQRPRFSFSRAWPPEQFAAQQESVKWVDVNTTAGSLEAPASLPPPQAGISQPKLNVTASGRAEVKVLVVRTFLEPLAPPAAPVFVLVDAVFPSRIKAFSAHLSLHCR